MTNDQRNEQATFSGPELCQKSACDVVAMLRNGDVSPLEVLDASLARIEAVEPDVNATPIICQERAHQHIKTLEQTAKGNDTHRAWLAGLPILIKDLNLVKGVRTTFGTKALANFIPSASDPLIELLETRGAIITGKTNTPEFGAGGNTFNDVFGYTRNPWDTRKNAGGSSGGAAVSLATGETWLSHGSDLAGSLRTPAAYCGVVGMRPTPGRCGGGSSTASFMIEGMSGPMARDVKDLALFLDAMCGYDARSPISIEEPAQSFQNAVKDVDPNVRIAFSVDQNHFAPVEEEIRAIMRSAMEKVEKAGANVEDICPQLPDLYETYVTIRGNHYGSINAAVPQNVAQHFKPTLRSNIESGLALTSQQIFKSNRHRAIIYENMRRFLQTYDVLAIPVVGLEPGLVEQEYPLHVDGQPVHDYVDWLRFSFLATTASLPAIAMPIGFTKSKMPVGIQLIGPPRGEAKLLKTALAIEAAVNFPKTPIDPIVRHR